MLKTAGQGTRPYLQLRENNRPRVLPSGNSVCIQCLAFHHSVALDSAVDTCQMSMIHPPACSRKINETVKPDSELSFAESFGRKTAGVVQGEFNVHFMHVTFQCPHSGRLPRGGHPLGRQSYVEDVSTVQCQLLDVSSCHVFS